MSGSPVTAAATATAAPRPAVAATTMGVGPFASRAPTLHAPLGLLAAGFAMDAYDLFAVNGVLVIWGTSAATTPSEVEKSLLTAVALIGAVVGQVVFGFAGDACGHGRPFVLTLTLMLCGALVSAVMPTADHTALFAGIIAARLVMGVGIGGEYPLSVVISSRLHLSPGQSKAATLATVFALQGVGIAVAVTCCYALYVTCTDDTAWRLTLGLGAAFSLTLAAFRFHYLRDLICARAAPPPPPLSLALLPPVNASPHGPSREADCCCDCSGNCCLHAVPFLCGCTCVCRSTGVAPEPLSHALDSAAGPRARTHPNLQQTPLPAPDTGTGTGAGVHSGLAPHTGVANGLHDPSDPHDPDHPMHRPLTAAEAHAHQVMGCAALWRVIATDTVVRWRLLGTCLNWFLLDIVFYANGLFSATLLTHFTGNNPERTLRYNLYLGLIGLPGYAAAVVLIRNGRLTRRVHQTGGFALLGVAYLICAFQIDAMEQSLTVLLVLYGLTFFLSNAGPNTTTYVLSGESFPPYIRTSCSGLSAAAGKIGAAASAYGMAPLAAYSLQAVFITCGCISFVGALTTFALTAAQPALDALNPAPRPRLHMRPASVLAPEGLPTATVITVVPSAAADARHISP